MPGHTLLQKIDKRLWARWDVVRILDKSDALKVVASLVGHGCGDIYFLVGDDLHGNNDVR